MLFLRFLIQNNETSSYINLSRAIALCPQIPPQFNSFDNYIQAIVVGLNGKNDRRDWKKRERSIISENVNMKPFMLSHKHFNWFKSQNQFIQNSTYHISSLYYCTSVQIWIIMRITTRRQYVLIDLEWLCRLVFKRTSEE